MTYDGMVLISRCVPIKVMQLSDQIVFALPARLITTSY